MKTRIISGIVMVPLLLIIYFGGIPLLAAAALIAYVGVTEFYNGFENMGVHPSKPIAYVMITILYAGHLFLGVNHTFLMAWVILSMMVSMIYGWKITERKPYDAVATLTALVYIVLFSYHIVIIDNTPYPKMTWLVVIAASVRISSPTSPDIFWENTRWHRTSARRNHRRCCRRSCGKCGSLRNLRILLLPNHDGALHDYRHAGRNQWPKRAT